MEKKSGCGKKIGIAAIVIVVLFGVFAIGSGGTSSSSSSSSEADYSNMSIGQTAVVGKGLAVTVNSVEAFTPEYLDTPMIRVNVTYENNTDDKQSFNLLDWKAEDANGAERTITAWADGKTDLGSGDLKPGGHVTGNVYFDDDGIAKIYYYSNILFQSDSDVCWNVA